jgi:hypothetical protein
MRVFMYLLIFFALFQLPLLKRSRHSNSYFLGGIFTETVETEIDLAYFGDFHKDINYPHHMKKPDNISFYSTSVLGKLFDISREIFSDYPLPSFSVPLPTSPLNSTPFSLPLPLSAPLHVSMPTTMKSFNDRDSASTFTNNKDNHHVLYGAVGDDSEMGKSPIGNEVENYFDIFGCDTLSYVDDIYADIYTGNPGFNGDTVYLSDTDSRPHIPETLSHATPFTSSHPYSHPLPSPPLSPPLSFPYPLPTSIRHIAHPHPSTSSIPRTSVIPTPLETLALDSIPMDLDLRTQRASDFLEVATRLYTRYVLYHTVLYFTVLQCAVLFSAALK